MRDRDYYPAGAYSDPYAPYNEVSIPERDFEVLATVTLTHNTTVTTDKYNPEYDEETGRTDADTSDTDFTAIYEDECFNIPQLLAYLKEYAERDLASDNPSQKKYILKQIIADCEGLEIEETEVKEL